MDKLITNYKVNNQLKEQLNNQGIIGHPPAFDIVNLPVKNIQAFQTTRISPNLNKHSKVVKSPFNYFNIGDHVNDNPQNVTINRQNLLTYLPRSTQIQWLNQVHGNHVNVIAQYSSKPLTADAVITTSPKIALAIMTADCLPILLSNNEGTEIAAIHGGWRPLADNIISHTLNKMKSKNEDIVAWLGPCISQTNFEVGNEVKVKFEQLNPNFSSAFQLSNRNKWLADLQQITMTMLIAMGVKKIDQNDACTYAQGKRYYSYRRDNQTGRMASIICIK